MQEIQTPTERQEGKFIYCDGKYWLVHHYEKKVGFDGSGGGWFASPVFFPKPDEVKVGVGAGNWCYVCNGAFLKNPEKEVMIKAYQSYLEHLNWNKMIAEKMSNDDPRVQGIIDYYEELIKQ